MNVTFPLDTSLWRPYQAASPPTGKLCYYLCSPHSNLPVRDVLSGHGKGNKVEPNYETATYNHYAACLQSHVSAASGDRISHLLFVTRYEGYYKQYQKKYFVVGYYEIGWTAFDGQKTAVRAERMVFAPISGAYEISSERWQRINTNGTTSYLCNSRYATQRLSGALLNEVLEHLDRHDNTEAYLCEVARLKAEYNPFKEVPSGRIFVINVGANSSDSLQSPLFDDGRFEFVPIPEISRVHGEHRQTYGSLRQFYYPDRPLLDLFENAHVTPDHPVHDDPEFLTLTYGDNVYQRSSNLQDVEAGDFLFFLARLVSFDGRFHNDAAIFALIGYLHIEEKLSNPSNPQFISPAFHRNAHVARWQADPESFRPFAIFKGSVHSRRFRYAVPVDRSLVEQIPLTTSSGKPWQWNNQSELQTIGSYTRTPRLHIDPSRPDGERSAHRFWHHIWQMQGWEPRAAM